MTKTLAGVSQGNVLWGFTTHVNIIIIVMK